MKNNIKRIYKDSEMQEILIILWKWRRIIIFVSIIVTLVSFCFFKIKPDKYEISFIVSRPPINYIDPITYVDPTSYRDNKTYSYKINFKSKYDLALITYNARDLFLFAKNYIKSNNFDSNFDVLNKTATEILKVSCVTFNKEKSLKEIELIFKKLIEYDQKKNDEIKNKYDEDITNRQQQVKFGQELIKKFKNDLLDIKIIKNKQFKNNTKLYVQLMQNENEILEKIKLLNYEIKINEICIKKNKEFKSNYINKIKKISIINVSKIYLKTFLISISFLFLLIISIFFIEYAKNIKNN